MSFCTVEISELNEFGLLFGLLLAMHDGTVIGVETIPQHVLAYLLKHVKSQAEFIDSKTGQTTRWHLYRNANPLSSEIPIVVFTKVYGKWRVHSYDTTIPQ